MAQVLALEISVQANNIFIDESIASLLVSPDIADSIHSVWIAAAAAHHQSAIIMRAILLKRSRRSLQKHTITSGRNTCSRCSCLKKAAAVAHALQQAAGPCDAAVHASKKRNTVLILSTTAILQRGHLLWQAYCMAASASPLPADRPTAMQLVPADASSCPT